MIDRYIEDELEKKCICLQDSAHTTDYLPFSTLGVWLASGHHKPRQAVFPVQRSACSAGHTINVARPPVSR